MEKPNRTGRAGGDGTSAMVSIGSSSSTSWMLITSMGGLAAVGGLEGRDSAGIWMEADTMYWTGAAGRVGLTVRRVLEGCSC